MAKLKSATTGSKNKNSRAGGHSPKLALITGATAGIGRATALALASAGSDLIVTGRREKNLKELKAEIEAAYKVKVHAFTFDISKRSACEQVIKKNAELFKKVDLLVNNAGLAKGADFLQDGKFDDWDEMIDTNIKGLLYMTRLVVPTMLANKRGHVINLGSVAGRWVYPKGNVYCASKFAVRALSEGLRMDLLGTPIRVTNIAPGMVETEFSLIRLGDPRMAKKVYEGLKPLSAQDVADAILWSALRPPHVNVQEIILYPTAQASVYHVHRV